VEGRRASKVDKKNKSFSLDRFLKVSPFFPPFGYIFAFLLGGLQCFFEAKVKTLQLSMHSH